jgi:DNA polymerase III delta prime subunit
MGSIHQEVITKLSHFITNKKIPNIIFHGPNGCGKNTILSNFIRDVYNDLKPVIKTHVMTVNCAYGRGIRFIREDLKYFAKTNLDTVHGEMFKSIVLLNADKLTIDAQSALRRCIELFCHSTRFFIVVEDKNKLLKPILSRFCEIYVPPPTTSKSSGKGGGRKIIAANLHTVKLEQVLGFKKHQVARIMSLKRILLKNGISVTTTTTATTVPNISYTQLIEISEHLVENGYSALDVIRILEEVISTTSLENGSETDSEKESEKELFRNHELLLAFNGVKREFRNEKLLILFILYFIVFRSELDLKNITFI